MRRLITLAATALIALGLAPAAHAADLSWDLSPQNTPQISTTAAQNALHHIWLDQSQCGGDGIIRMRARTATGWGPIRRLQKACPDKTTRMGRPVLARDSGTGAEFIVYALTDLAKPARSGVYYSRIQGAGAKVTAPKRLASTPAAIKPVPVTAAARSSRLWVMWQTPKDAGERAPRFAVQAFRQADGGRSSRNIAVGSGHFRANASNGSMQLFAARLGLVAVWSYTDIAGKSRTYIADTERYATSVGDQRRTGLNYRGEIGLTNDTHVIVGEDRRLYRLTENRDEEADLVTFDVSMWSFISDRFRPVPGVKDVAMGAGDLRLGRQALAFQVDAQRNMYLAYLDFGSYTRLGGENCTTGDDASTRCVRATAPTPAEPAVFVNKITPGSAVTQARVPWSFTPQASAGANTIEWILPPRWGSEGASGLETITTQFGGVRLLMAAGHQDIARSGAVETGNYDYTVVLTDPLQFNHTPSFNPVDHEIQRTYGL